MIKEPVVTLIAHDEYPAMASQHDVLLLLPGTGVKLEALTIKLSSSKVLE